VKHSALNAVLAALAAVVTWSGAVEAAVPVRVDEDHGRARLRPHLELAVDPGGSWTVSDVINGHAPGEFRAATGTVHHVGFSTAVHWARLALVNPSDQRDERWLELSRGIDHATLFTFSAATPLSSRELGKLMPFSKRDVAHTSILFKVLLEPNETRHLLLRLQSEDTFFIDPVLWTPSAFLVHAAGERLLEGLFLGVLLAMVAYNLFLLFATRDWTYLHYVLFQAANLACIVAIDQTSFQYLWPESPRWAARSETVFAALTIGTSILFARSFLETRRLAPRLDRVMGAVAALCLVLGPVSAAVQNRAAMAGLAQIAIFAAVGLLVVGVELWRKRSPNAPVFVIAWTVLLVGVAVNMLMSVGVFPSSSVAEQFHKVGAAIEAVLLSMGLGQRIRRLQAEREQAKRAMLAEREERVAALHRLVSGVAHEIGNPLNFGAGGARELARPLGELESAAERGELSEALARCVKKAVAAAGLVRTANERIQIIIENLRTYVGQRRPPVQPVELHHELRKTLQLLAERTERHAIEIVQRVDPFPPYPCVPGEFGQVFLNLGMNAIQAMPDGGILTVEGKSSDEWLEISVSDTGPGVSAEQRAIIFEAFFTTRGPNEGTGLGLSVSREIVRRHGGELLLAPSQRGAKFVVRLPLNPTHVPIGVHEDDASRTLRQDG
jgi:signal transduction histidine kinase